MLQRLKAWAARLKSDVHALYLAGRDPRTPVLVKILCVAVAAYALSPIDLIPDFIPVIGFLDELILLPCALVVVRALIPAELWRELKAKADGHGDRG